MQWLSNKEIKKAIDNLLESEKKNKDGYNILIIVKDKMTKENTAIDVMRDILHRITVGRDNITDFALSSELGGFKIYMLPDWISIIKIVTIPEIAGKIDYDEVLIDNLIPVEDLMWLGKNQREVWGDEDNNK